MEGLLQDTPLTLRWIFPRLERIFPDRGVATARNGRIVRRRSYAELARRARRLGSALDRIGVQPGERVVTFSHNSDDHLEQMLGIIASGRVYHGLNPRLPPAELQYIVNHARDSAVFVDAELLESWKNLGVLASIRHTLVVSAPDTDVPEDYEDYESFLQRGDDNGGWPELDEKSAAALCYTSGTTGHPKGVLYSHRGLALVSMAWMLGDAMAVSERDTFLPAVPFFHAQAWALPFSALLAGSHFVIAGADVSPVSLARLMESEQVTFAIGVPTIWSNMLAAIDAGEVDPAQLQTLDRIASGGSAIPRWMLERYDAMGVRLTQTWGMTEMSPLGTVSRIRSEASGGDQYQYRIMQGVPSPFVDLRIVDDAGRELPWDGEAAGEVQASGPWIADAYYDPEAPDGRMDADGFVVDDRGRRWLRTGDVGRIDHLGYLHLLDRIKDLVKSGGEWISSVWLEQVIDTCPGVRASAVIAVYHEKWGERPLAIVERRPGEEVTEKEILEHVRKQVPKWQMPEGVVFVPELPRTSLGKLDKRRLREQYGSTAPSRHKQ
jgi:fatty-acyl-CoA synthase